MDNKLNIVLHTVIHHYDNRVDDDQYEWDICYFNSIKDAKEYIQKEYDAMRKPFGDWEIEYYISLEIMTANASSDCIRWSIDDHSMSVVKDRNDDRPSYEMAVNIRTLQLNTWDSIEQDYIASINAMKHWQDRFDLNLEYNEPKDSSALLLLFELNPTIIKYLIQYKNGLRTEGSVTAFEKWCMDFNDECLKEYALWGYSPSFNEEKEKLNKAPVYEIQIGE